MWKGLSGPEPESVKKKAIKVFKDFGLKMILKANLHVMNFSNIAELLRNNTNEPCRKPKNHHVYMDKNSNLQKAILRKLPKLISKRLSDLSSTIKIFEKATPIYS